MDIYTPIVAIIIYLATLMAPGGTNEFTFAADREIFTLKTEDGAEWKMADGRPGMIAFKDGYFIEALQPNGLKEAKEKMSDHIPIPTNLEKGEIHLKRTPIKIEFTEKDQLIIFTVTRSGQDSSEIRISWAE